MKNSMYPLCHALASRYYLMIIALLVSFLIPENGYGQCVASKGTIEGVVFSDFNNNGIINAGEEGIADILVFAYDSKGALIGNTTTSSSGSYSFLNLADGEKIRLTFGFNGNYASSFMGKDNGSSVQFVQVPACNVRFGLTSESDVCNSETEILTTCFVQGTTNVRPNEPTIVGIKYGFNSTTPARKFAMHGETGSIWGLAWKNSTKEIFSAAFVKQYAGLKDSHDAIFRTVFNGAMYTTQLFTKLSDLGIDAGVLTITDISDCEYGDQVGKIGLGSMVLSPDEKYLYVVNIYDNSLVKISTVNPTEGNTQSYKIPGVGAHAFALKYYNNRLYVGTTIPGDVALIYAFDPSKGEFSDTGLKIPAGVDWENNTIGGKPAHWLTDIDFTDEGNMLISLSDRIGHKYCNAATNRLDEQKGDLLIAFKTETGWELEDRSEDKEFFSDDFWIPNPTYHPEVTIGSIFVMPGSGSVVATVFDPELNSYSGGLHRYNTSTGKKEGSKELYTREIVNLFGKATGFGEIISTCGLPEIEIGNLVWKDENSNGFQDADEIGISDLVLNIFDEDCHQIGTTSTDNKGVYVFNSTNVTGGLFQDRLYYIGIDGQHFDNNAGSYKIGAEFLSLTKPTNGFSLIDSDASGNEMNCSQSLIEVKVFKTQHTFDIGLVPAGDCSLKISKSVVNQKAARNNDIIIFEISVVNRGTSVISEVEISDKTPLGYLFTADLNPDWIDENGVLKTTFKEKLFPGTSFSAFLSLSFDNKVKNIDFTNTVKISQIKDAGGNIITDMTACFDLPDDGESRDFPDVCDLALIHKLDADKIYTPDSDVTLVTTVCNQGTIDATTYQITNYLNKELDFDPKLNPGWIISDDLKSLTYEETKILTPLNCRDYHLVLTILDDTDVSQIINYAEISEGSCTGTAASFDFDSSPDGVINNDKGGQPNTATDNMLDDSGEIDEDDHDPLIIQIKSVDVSLLKSTESKRVKPGQSITFNLDMKNEGTMTVSSMKLIDYIPDYLILDDPRWTKSGNDAELVVTFPFGFEPGDTHRETIILKVAQNAPSQVLVNSAEIVEFFDDKNADISYLDIDSKADDIRDNDYTNDTEKDLTEDDFDTANLIIGEVDVQTLCLNNATNSINGQCETTITFLGNDDDDWYIEQNVGFYRDDSPAPPASPNLYATGYILTEQVFSPGISRFTITGRHVEGEGFSLRLRSAFGDLEDIIVNNGCTYNDVAISGPRSLCAVGSATYSVPFIPGAFYSWGLDGLPVGGNQNSVNIDWSIYGPGNYTLIVNINVDGQCYSPGIATVSIGVADNQSIACVGDFNVSLDGNCELVITPAMLVAGSFNSASPYVVMLTDIHGHAINNATLTSAHVGTKVIAKLIEGCGGNSCWSTITVEDKLAPVSLCQDISLPCYLLDEYNGPFEIDNCGGPVTNIIVSETITPLTCDRLYVKFIDRVYQATDKFGNKSALCSMRISVERPDVSLVKFPPSFLMIKDSALVCSSFAKDEFGNPSVSVTGVPTLGGLLIYPFIDEICNLYVAYKDVDLGYIGCTRKIMRNWTVYEQWCTVGVTRNFVQVIEINDSIPPVIKPLADITITTNGHHVCEGDVILPIPVVTDSCSGVREVNVTYTGGFIKDIKVATKISLPVGTHTITYTAYDGCLNSSSTSFIVTVEDKTPPTVICKGELVVGLNSNGEAYLYPRHINDGSFDGCGIDRMKVAKMVQGGLIPDSLFLDFVEFGCIDAGRSVMVALRVWDVNGNSNSCMMNVTIQDKHAPQITCPAHLTIDCSDVFSGMDLQQYGTATAIDACGAVITELPANFVLNSCRVGYIERTFVATDGLGSSSCTQIITVENEDYFDPLTDVVKPLDYEVFDKCSPDELLPENLPALYGYPVITQSACGMAAASYKDAVYTFVTGACYKIVRTWTIIDWCEMQRLEDDYVPYVFQQIIKVNNTVPPFFVELVPDRDTFFTEKGNCIEGLVDLKVTGKDLCTPDNKLRWSYKIDYYNDGVNIIPNSGLGNMATINSLFPVGLHKLSWSFEDACGNVITKDQLILVRNNDNPTAAGLERVSVSINPWDTDQDGIPDIERACIKAWTLDASSSSLCCIEPLRFSFSADVNDTIRCFDCFDVGLDIIVQLWVHDCNDRTDFVNVHIEVQDNNTSDVCENICDTHPVSPSITGNNIVCDGVSTTLTAFGGVKYNWSTGETTNSITVSPAVTTTYTVTVTNEFRCTATAERIVTVNPKPNVVISGANICNGGSTTLTASGGNSYVWNTGATTAAINVSPLVSTTYTVTATNTNGCTASVSRIVVVSGTPLVSVTGTNIICRNNSTTLTASGGNTYLWNNGTIGNTLIVSPISNTTYTVTATDINGCTASSFRAVTVNQLPNVNIEGNNQICTGNSTTLTASGGISYLWSNAAITPAINVSPLVSTTYTVTATDANGCTNTANRLVTVNALPSPNITGDNIICIGESTQLTATGGGTYLWNTGAVTPSITVIPIVNTTYTVTVTNANGCTNTSNILVTVNGSASAQINGVNAICTGANTNLTASGGVSYLWNTGAITAIINVAPVATTTYTVTVTNANGCTGTSSKILTVNPLPIAVISGDQSICLGESTVLTASGGVSYLWNTNAITAAINVSPLINTTYTVTVTDVNGCTASTLATVTVDPGTLICSTQNITVYLDANGAVTINPDQISTGNTGACTNIQATVNPAMFFCNDVGVKIVTLTVTNTNNNQTLTCTAQVTVRDTIKPMLTCPPNLTINCDDFNPNAPLSTYGTATASDNCNVGLIITEFPIINLNQCNVGQISRTFTVTDNSNNSTQCVQLISVVNNNPVGLANITFPPDITVSNCVGVSTTVTGVTTVNTSNADCSDISIEFTDDLPIASPLCSDTIRRTWIVRDSCQLVTGTTNGIFTRIQNIVVMVEAPVITGPTDTILVVDLITCEASLSGIFHAVSGCNLTLSNSINNSATFNLTGVYPAGTTTVVLTATEGCSNLTATYEFFVQVMDTVSTDLRCMKTFPQMRDLSPPNTRDNVSNHAIIEVACGNNLNIIPSYSNTNIDDTVRVYFCDDVLLDWPITVYFWSNGVVIDSCTSLATPTDPNGFCTDGLITVAGNIQNEKGQLIPNVNISLLGSEMAPLTSDLSGKYKFPYMNPGGEYDVVPTRNDNPLEGVSTLDLIYIQRHILKTEELNTPYKLVAADINKDGRITAADIVQLRKVILGIHDNFSYNTSWRMIDKAYEFPDAKDPFLTPFPEKYHIESLNSNMRIDWIGVKTGDVNSSYVTNVNSEAVESRVSSFSLILPDQSIVKGENMISVHASSDLFFNGFQVSLKMENISEVNISPALINIEDFNYSYKDGRLYISWHNTDGLSIKSDDHLFDLHFTSQITGIASNVISLENSVLTPEYYSSANEIQKLGVRFISTGDDIFRTLGNTPNPWNNQTSINFHIPAHGEVKLKIRDITGRMVFTYKDIFQKGDNSIIITKEQLGASGILFYELSFGNEVKTMKMLNIK